MEDTFLETLVLFVVFFIVDAVLLAMIFKKKYRPTSLTLQDGQGVRYTVSVPGTIETCPPERSK